MCNTEQMKIITYKELKELMEKQIIDNKEILDKKIQEIIKIFNHILESNVDKILQDKTVKLHVHKSFYKLDNYTKMNFKEREYIHNTLRRYLGDACWIIEDSDVFYFKEDCHIFNVKANIN